MKFDNKLAELLEVDPKLQEEINIEVVRKEKDPFHLERRQQQRAITNNMITVALLYGKVEFIHGAKCYTLTDKSLENTDYSKYINELRGLKIVELPVGENNSNNLLTALWNDKVRNRKRKRNNDIGNRRRTHWRTMPDEYPDLAA